MNNHEILFKDDNFELTSKKFYELLFRFYGTSSLEIKGSYFSRETIDLFCSIEHLGRLLEEQNDENTNINKQPDTIKAMNSVKTLLIGNNLIYSLCTIQKIKRLKNKHIGYFYEVLTEFVRDHLHKPRVYIHELTKGQCQKLFVSGWLDKVLEAFREKYNNSGADGTGSERWLERHKKLRKEILKDLNEVVPIAKRLFALGLVIRFEHHGGLDDPDFFVFGNNLDQYFNVLKNDESIVRVYYKCTIGNDHRFEYFVIVLVQELYDCYEDSKKYDWIEQVLSDYADQEYGWEVSASIKIDRWNPVINENDWMHNKVVLSAAIPEDRDRILKSMFGFLFELDRFEDFSSCIYRNFYTEDNNFNSYIYFYKMGKVETNTLIVSDFLDHPNIGRIWDVGHLSNYAQNYVANLSIVYKENFSYQIVPLYKVGKYHDLVIKIESFMLSLIQTSVITFDVFRRSSRVAPSDSLYHLVVRTMLQFVHLSQFRKEILDVKNLLELSRYSSQLLDYYLHVFEKNKNDIEYFLVNDIRGTLIEKSDSLLEKFVYDKSLFSRKDKFSLADDSIDNILRQNNQWINIPRYRNRVNQVTEYIKNAFKKDCVIIRCRLTCTIDNGCLKHKTLSYLLYQMLHAGKRKAPFSQLRAYLGFWGENRGSDGQGKPSYFADIFLIFDQLVMFGFPNINNEVEIAWCNVLEKEQNKNSYHFAYTSSAFPTELMRSVDVLNTKRLVIEKIDKKLQQSFISNVIPYVVYQDIIENEFYYNTPKWLIRGTLPRKPVKLKGKKK